MFGAALFVPLLWIFTDKRTMLLPWEPKCMTDKNSATEHCVFSGTSKLLLHFDLPSICLMVKLKCLCLCDFGIAHVSYFRRMQLFCSEDPPTQVISPCVGECRNSYTLPFVFCNASGSCSRGPHKWARPGKILRFGESNEYGISIV